MTKQSFESEDDISTELLHNCYNNTMLIIEVKSAAKL